MKCSICDTEISWRFCPNCGQEFLLKKNENLLLLFLSELLAFENKIVHTLRYFPFKPTFVVNNYVTGFRGYFSNPFRFFFFMIGLLGLFYSFFTDSTTVFGVNVSVKGAGSFSENIQFKELLIILFIVVLIIFSSKVVFRKKSWLFNVSSTFYAVNFSMVLVFATELWVHLFNVSDLSGTGMGIAVILFVTLLYNAIIGTNNKHFFRIAANFFLLLVVFCLWLYALYLTGNMVNFV